MTQPIDTAYVDIVVRDKSLDKVRKDIDKTFDKIDKDVEKDLKSIDDQFADLFEKIDKRFNDLEDSVDGVFQEMIDISADATSSMEHNIDRSVKKSRKHLDDLGDKIHNTFDDIEDKVDGPLKRAFLAIGGIIGNVGTTIGQLGSAIGGAASSSPLLALILVLTPAIIALAAALSQLIGLVGLVPAGFTVLLASIIPVVVAFQNFGGAVSAVMSGDLEKMNEALAKLAPNARAVALEIGRLMPVFKTLQLTTQQAFFQPLVGAATQLINSVFPKLEIGFTRVAFAMGTLLRQVINFFSLPEQGTFIDNLFKASAHLIATFGPNLVKFLAGFLEAANAALPTLVRLGDAFNTAFGKFGDFIAKAAQDGSLQTFIDEAIKTVKELFALVQALGGLLGTLFAGTEDAGHGFIVSLTEMITRLDEFFKTAEGQDVIDAIVFSVKALAAALSFSIETLVFFTKTFKMMLQFLETVGRGFVEFVTMIGEWLAKIPGFIVTFISGIPTMVGNFFKGAIDAALTALGIGIGLILFSVQVLPGKIIDFLKSLPQRIYDIIVAIGPLVATAFQNAVDFGRDILINGFENIIEFIRSVPGRIKDLIPTFGSAGKNLIESFMNGFKSVGSFIGDVAGDIVGAVKGFLNKAIDRINEGIAKVDAVLPGDLGRIPRLAQGAFVPRRPGGVTAVVGEGSEDEWVLPQSKLDALMGSGTTITFGPGAINLNFSGALPTEAEARGIGETIGKSLAAMIARRDLQTQVRAI